QLGLTVACCNPKIGKKFVQTFADCYPKTLYKFISINHGTFFHENQLRFWESPHSYELHDPRGTHEYIQRCIEPLKLFIEQQQQQRQQPQQQSNQKSIILTYDNLGLKTHMPHTNIMDCLNKTLKQVKIQSFSNGKYIKPNKEELQAYGVDINDNLSEISGGSEEEE
ncbi:unnamed protein product, partial [Schistosoma curassoni]|uniref:CRAL-TRIO domain-containing protein n=1 Tax=Schistosoma curassoni TaxID=6186 RepID=A0A183L1U5_9TREM